MKGGVPSARRVGATPRSFSGQSRRSNEKVEMKGMPLVILDSRLQGFRDGRATKHKSRITTDETSRQGLSGR
jgi:hypothetical protein